MAPNAIDHFKILTDASQNVSVKEWKLTSADVGGDSSTGPMERHHAYPGRRTARRCRGH